MANVPKSRDFSLIETMRLDPETGFARLDRHLGRLKQSADALGFVGADGAASALSAVSTADGPLRVRLELFGDGQIEVTTAPYVPLAPLAEWRAAIASTRLSSTDPLLAHKTSRRDHYQAARAEFPASDIDEVVLLNERGEICEGSITTLFVPDDEGLLLTPPLECGLLAGVLRAELLQTGKAEIAKLSPKDLIDRQFFLGNSLRGLIPARLAASFDEKAILP